MIDQLGPIQRSISPVRLPLSSRTSFEILVTMLRSVLPTLRQPVRQQIARRSYASQPSYHQPSGYIFGEKASPPVSMTLHPLGLPTDVPRLVLSIGLPHRSPQQRVRSGSRRTGRTCTITGSSGGWLLAGSCSFTSLILRESRRYLLEVSGESVYGI